MSKTLDGSLNCKAFSNLWWGKVFQIAKKINVWALPMYCLLTWKVRYWESYKLCFFWKVKVAHCPISFFLRQKTSQQNRKAREEKLHLGTEIISVADTWKSVLCHRCLNPPHGQTSPPSPSQGTPVRLCSALQACWSPLASCRLHWLFCLAFWWLSFLRSVLFPVARHLLHQVLRELVARPSHCPPALSGLPSHSPLPPCFPAALSLTFTCGLAHSYRTITPTVEARQTTKYWKDFPCHIKDPPGYRKSMPEYKD